VKVVEKLVARISKDLVAIATSGTGREQGLKSPKRLTVGRFGARNDGRDKPRGTQEMENNLIIS
jgi:hypothetical protein